MLGGRREPPEAAAGFWGPCFGVQTPPPQHTIAPEVLHPPAWPPVVQTPSFVAPFPLYSSLICEPGEGDV